MPVSGVFTGPIARTFSATLPSRTALKFTFAYLLVCIAIFRLYKSKPVRSTRAKAVLASALVAACVPILQLECRYPGYLASHLAVLPRIITLWGDSAALWWKSLVINVVYINTKVGSTAAAQVRGLTDYANSQVRNVQSSVRYAVENRIDMLTSAAISRIANAVIDPHMPSALQALIRETFHRVTPQVKKEIVRRANRLLMTPDRVRPEPLAFHDAFEASASNHADNAESELVDSSYLAQIYVFVKRFRAFVLYNLAPADKSGWASMRNPAYWTLTAVGFIPISWLTYMWWLLLFLWRERKDEYQLVDFIIGYETSKFFGGCWSLLHGAGRYFLCTSFPVTFPCQEFAPATSMLDSVVFFLQISLVLWAYYELWHLPSERRSRNGNRNSVDSGEHLSAGRLADQPGGRVSEGLDLSSMLSSVMQHNGGALHLLWGYQLCVVCMVAFLGTCALAFDYVHSFDRQPIAPATFFWLRTVYGLLAIPYVVFKLPLVTRLYVTSRHTGYDFNGRLVRAVSASGGVQGRAG